MIDASLFEFNSPAAHAVDVSTADANLATIWPDQPYARSLYVGSGGDLKVDLLGSTGITFSAVPSGATLRGVFVKAYHVGTSASGLVAFK